MIVLAKRAGLPSAAVGGLVAVTGVAGPCLACWSFTCRCAAFCRCGRIFSGSTGRALGYIAFLLWPNVFVARGRVRSITAFWFPT